MRTLLAWLILLLAVSVQAAPVWPIQTNSANGHYLVDMAGNPVLLHGQAAWSAFTAASTNDWITWCAAKQTQGVNAVIVEMTDNYYQALAVGTGYTYAAPTNWYGEFPFTNVNDFTTANPAYFDRCKTYLNIASNYGMTVIIFPAYVGNVWEHGWGAQTEPQSASQLQTYGTFLASNFLHCSNIVWSTGGDAVHTSGGGTNWTTGLKNAHSNIVVGIRNYSPRYLVVGHAIYAEDTPATSVFGNYPTLRGAYHYTSPMWQFMGRAWTNAPYPIFHYESTYEREGSGLYARTNYIMRNLLWSYTWGGQGTFFGSSGTWKCDNWLEDTNLYSPLSAASTHIYEFFNRFTLPLVPDYTNVFGDNHKTNDTWHKVTTCWDVGKTNAIAFVPVTNYITTINLDSFGTETPIREVWFEYLTNTYTTQGLHAASGSVTFTNPMNSDAVLWLFPEEQPPVVFRPSISISGRTSISGSTAIR